MNHTNDKSDMRYGSSILMGPLRECGSTRYALTTLLSRSLGVPHTEMHEGLIRGGSSDRISAINSMFLEPSIDTCPLVRRCQAAASEFTTPSSTWIEPVGYWRKAYRLACLHHTMLLQIIMTMFPTLHSIIVLADDPRGKRRPKGNSTLNHTRKRLLLSIYFKWLTLDIQYK